MKLSQNSYRWAVTLPIVAAVVTVAPLAGFTDPVNAEKKSFSDMPANESGYSEVMELAEQGIIHGYEDRTFRPYERVSREHVAVLLTKALDLPTPKDVAGTISVYDDVNEHATYVDEIAAVTQADIFQGKGGSFRPKEPISRAQMASALARAFKLKETGEPVELEDIDNIDGVHRKHVEVLAQHGIAVGRIDHVGKRYFDGEDNLERVHFATFLSKALKAPKTIYEVDNERVMISGKAYPFEESLKSIFNKKNEDALKEAGISFNVSKGVIAKVHHLELVEKQLRNGSYILDGQGKELVNDVTIRSKKYVLNNLALSGDLRISVPGFKGKGLKVVGNTFVDHSEANKLEMAPIIFEKSSLEAITIGKQGGELELREGSNADSVKVMGVSSINASSDVTIPKLVMGGEAKDVTLNGNVTKAKVAVASAEMTLQGRAHIKQLTVGKTRSVNLALTGSIDTLYLKSNKAKLTLGKEMQIDNIVIPFGKNIRDCIRNYDAVKGQIGSINGEPNVDKVTQPSDNEDETDKSDEVPENSQKPSEKPESLPDEEGEWTDDSNEPSEEVSDEKEKKPIEVAYHPIDEISDITPKEINYADGKFTVPTIISEFSFKDGEAVINAKMLKGTWLFETAPTKLEPAKPFITVVSNIELVGLATIKIKDVTYTATIESKKIENEQYVVRIVFDNIMKDEVETSFDLNYLKEAFSIKLADESYEIVREDGNWTVVAISKTPSEEIPVQDITVQHLKYAGQLISYTLNIVFDEEMGGLITPNDKFTVSLLDEDKNTIAVNKVIGDIHLQRIGEMDRVLQTNFYVSGLEGTAFGWNFGSHNGKSELDRATQLKIEFEKNNRTFAKIFELSLSDVK